MEFITCSWSELASLFFVFVLSYHPLFVKKGRKQFGRIFVHPCEHTVSSPVTEAHLGLEGTVVLAAAQTAALIAAQRWDQVDRT